MARPYLRSMFKSFRRSSEKYPGKVAFTCGWYTGGVFAKVHDSPNLLVYSQISALFLRETLLRIQRHWSDLVRDGDAALQCPIKIEGDELLNHQKDGRRYNEFQDLLKARNIHVADEGWVPLDEFSERKDSLKTVIKETLESLESQNEVLEFKSTLRSWNLTNWGAT